MSPPAYNFRPAARENTPLVIGIAGPSGSGKTASGLKLARGILGGKDDGIFMIDTEANRGLHYACAPGEKPGDFRFRFQHLRMEPPFSPSAYQEAIAAAVTAGAKLVFVDSMSHEHEGQGGILEWHERELDRMAGQDYAKRERMTFAAWIKPKSAHNQFVNFILQQPCHFIFGFRAKDKMKLLKVMRDGRERTEPVQLGWTPICSDRFEYEMTTLLMLPPSARGVPDITLEATKINAHHVSFFPAGQPIAEKAGEQLAAWALGGGASSTPPSTPTGPAEAGRKLLEEIQAELVKAYPGQTPADKEAKSSLMEKAFGVRAWSAVKALAEPELRAGLEKLRRPIQVRGAQAPDRGAADDTKAPKAPTETQEGSASTAAPESTKVSPPNERVKAGDESAPGLFPTAQELKPPAPKTETQVAGVDVDDEAQVLAKAIEAEKANLQRQPPDEKWDALCTELVGTTVLEIADPAALQELLELVKQLVAQDPDAIARVTKIIAEAGA